MLTLSGLSPAPGEDLVALDSSVEFTIVDDGSGIDISSLIVILKGVRAINGLEFSNGFDGPFSSINPSGNNFNITIDPTSDFLVGKVYSIQIQVKNLDGKYLNQTYSFKTIPEEPILIRTSPNNNTTIVTPQLLYLEFDDIIDGVDPDSLTIAINGLNYITNGVIDPNYNGELTDVISSGTNLEVRIDTIEELKNGDYFLTYDVSDLLGNMLQGEINFTVEKPEEILPTGFSQTEFLGYFQGLERVTNLGDGKSVKIEWNQPISKTYKSDLFVLVYENEYRLNVFDQPKYIALSSESEGVVTGLTTGKTLSFGARALELPARILDTNGMENIDSGFFLIPANTTVTSTFDDSDLLLEVASTEGYPNAGLLLVGREVIRYNSVDRINNIFSIPPNGRGSLNTIPGIYLSGDSVQLYLGCTDYNTVIIASTPMYHDGYGSGRPSNEEGLIITDYSDNDNTFFQGYDFCGWHDKRPIDALSDENSCGSYLGGESNGFKGFDLYDRLLSREETLLDTTGEPAILLRRLWDGTTCACVNGRSISPKVKSCNICYGTKYENGYDQFVNRRRSDGRIMISFDETPEDLKYGEKEHLEQDYKPNAWTLPIPTIRDRDLIVRFDLTNNIEFIYEVLNVSREKIFNRKFGRQRLSVQRLDKTDIVYTYNFDLTNIG